MKRSLLVAALSALLAPAFAQSATSAAPPTLETTRDVTRTVLPNGLTVLTKEVHAAPVVTVQIFYKIGSRNEARGVNGIAHQLEHMMFKGTTDRPIQFGRLLSGLGADFNAFTSYDQTGYYGTVQREKAGALLTLEADRMKNALIDPAGLASEKRVVLSEIQGDENSPDYRLSRAVQLAAFPNSPYGLTVGGTKSDIENFSADEVRAYYQKYYSPQYATLVVVGDFQTPQLLSQVRDLFGKLGKSGTAPVGVSAPLAGGGNEETLGNPAAKAPVVVREPGATPILNAVYPLPDISSPDVPALAVMDSVLYSGSRTSRLYQALAQTGLAAGISTSPINLLRGGWYDVSLTPAPGKTLQEVDAAYLKTVAELRDDLVPQAELERAKSIIRSVFVLGNRSITAQAAQLGRDATSANDYRYTDKFLAAIPGVTAADVQRVARKYLQDASRTVGYFEPTQATQAGGAASAGGGTQTSESFNAGPPVDPAQVAKYLPPFQAPGQAKVTLPESVKLPNGLQVFLLRDASTPTVTLSGAVRAGREFDSDQKAGLSDLVAAGLLNGTKTRSADQLAGLLDDNGVSFGASGGRDSVSLGGVSLAANLPTMIDVLADVLQNATFPEGEFKLDQGRTLQGIAQRDDNPGSVAQKVFQQTLFPVGNPLHTFASRQSVESITRADLAAFYKAHYRPDATILTFVGDFDPAAVKALLTQKLGGWQAAGSAPTATYPAPPRVSGVVRENEALPGKTQSVTFLGYPFIERSDPRFYAAQILNQVLGGDSLSSRLGTEIRDRLGLTYGIYSGFGASLHPGPFIIQLQTAPQDAARAVAATLALLKQTREGGLSQSEFATAQKSLLSEYAVGLANPDNLAATFTGNALLGLPLTELQQYQAQIGAVTLAQVNQAARELLDPQNIVVVTAGPPQGQ